MKRITYKSAGVDTKKADGLVADYRRAALLARTEGVVSGIGGFGGLYRPDLKNCTDPILVSSTDGVGTKLKLAFFADKHDTVGQDLVAMSANDILCSGASGLFFLDYISTGHIKPQVLKDLVHGIARACKEAGYALVGGETAEMPGMYKKDEYDLAGFGVGMVDRSRIIDGGSIKIGDAVIGLESSGPHSNGYSLIRKALGTKGLKRHMRELLEPTRLYARPVLGLVSKVSVKGIANITGGAFYDKIPRIIPHGMGIEIDGSSWEMPEIFKVIQKAGNVENREMFHTLNMGIGMALVVPASDADRAVSVLKDEGLRSWVIGKVVEGKREVVIR